MCFLVGVAEGSTAGDDASFRVRVQTSALFRSGGRWGSRMPILAAVLSSGPPPPPPTPLPPPSPPPLNAALFACPRQHVRVGPQPAGGCRTFTLTFSRRQALVQVRSGCAATSPPPSPSSLGATLSSSPKLYVCASQSALLHSRAPPACSRWPGFVSAEQPGRGHRGGVRVVAGSAVVALGRFTPMPPPSVDAFSFSRAFCRTLRTLSVLVCSASSITVKEGRGCQRWCGQSRQLGHSRQWCFLD